MSQSHQVLLRRQELQKVYPVSRAALYKRIQEGLFVPPIKLGLRSSAWPANEVQAIVQAQISGASHDSLRKLVETLVANRQAPGGAT